LNELTDIHKNLNEMYNDKIIHFCESNNNIEHEMLSSGADIHHIISFISKMRLIPEIKASHEIYYDSFYNPLGPIKQNFKKLSLSIGFPNIKLAIELLVSDTITFNIQTKLLIENYNILFIPVKYLEKDLITNTLTNFDLFNEEIFIKDATLENIFIPVFDFMIKNENSTIVLRGIFIPDEISLFMRSSIIIFNQLFLKRKQLESVIDGELSKNILRSLSIGEIITYSSEKIIDIITNNISKYNAIKNKNPHALFKENIKNNYSDFYNIIKILLKILL
jgi:hypothetical protein